MSNRITKQLLLSNNYWVLNKTVMKELGLETAVILSVFADAEEMLGDKEGWFFQTIETIEEITTLSRHKQNIAIKSLKDLGVLEQQNKGQPMKRYFRINYNKLTNLIESALHSSMSNSYNLKCEKSATSKEHSYEEHIYKELNPIVPLEQETRFNEFWKLYPRKIGKKECNRLYKKVSEEEHQLILKNIQDRLDTKEWKTDTKQNLQYILHPTTYIRNERWNDEIVGIIENENIPEFLKPL
jgi:hypothetical protein